jgi:hypothetical protein
VRTKREKGEARDVKQARKKKEKKSSYGFVLLKKKKRRADSRTVQLDSTQKSRKEKKKLLFCRCLSASLTRIVKQKRTRKKPT